MKYAILTVDDRLLCSFDTIRPILKGYGFRCTFFVTGATNLWTQWPDMNWDHVAQLDEEGFEIGNHTMNHRCPSWAIMEKDLLDLEEKLEELGVRKPVSFAYPGYVVNPNGQEVLKKHNYAFGRYGYANIMWHYNLNTRLHPVHPNFDIPHHLHITGALNHQYTFEHFKADMEHLPDESAAIFNTHHVIADDEIARLTKICRYIASQDNMTMITLRDVLKYSSLCPKQYTNNQHNQE